MMAFVIDPFACTVSEIDYSGNYQDIYSLIDAQTFDIAYINEKRDGIFVDDSGLLVEGNPVFAVGPKAKEVAGRAPAMLIEMADRGEVRLLAGKGLVLGCDNMGESVSPTLSLSELEELVAWTPFVTNGG